jgi:adenylylsulfate kinase
MRHRLKIKARTELETTQRELKGCTVWFTGLSGAGKSTLAACVHSRLDAAGYRVEMLDGDSVRRSLCKDLGFSHEARQENIRRISFVANLLARHGVIVLVSAITPYRDLRADVRARSSRYFEVFVNAPLAVCEQRDPKGLYRRARSGDLPNFTGVDDCYETPEFPDVEVRTDLHSIAECEAQIWERLSAFLRT